ncbi:tail fiber domain-containing protein [Sphingopyxis sp. LK2115]|jgi:hypothetical protein|uniref:tail fiber domain-containing protein n=1 Tax=Sphingopyxis sp. LK2115 TaxID=2744558 RepID=UPI0016617BCC|nr:tail fiber domain-containing protein [Sphingopyxis sp. LK2115]
MPTPFFADLVRELAQEGGTGPLTPTGAVPGHRRFAGVVPPGVSFHYAIAGIVHPDEWEVGTGRIGGDGRLLRDAVAASSAGGALVDFTVGLKTIALTVGADWFTESDAEAAALAAEVAGLSDQLASVNDAVAGKQPISTSHGSAATGEASDTVTVRRGGGWVNIPLSALAFRNADGRYPLNGALGAAAGSAAAPSISFAADTDTGFWLPAADSIGFVTGGAERMRLSAAGHLGIGLLSGAPSVRLHVKWSGEVQRLETTAGRGGGACYQGFYDPSGAKGFCGYSAGDDGFDIWNGLTHQIRFATSGTYRWAISSAGGFYPIADNAYTIGGSVNRVSEIYAVNGTINTSDAREKTWRGAPTAAELRAARRIARELGFFQWNEAIAEKGADGARMHFGVRAQAVWAIMADEGLIEPLAEGETPSSAYAFLCWDRWDAVEPVAAAGDVRDKEGSIVAEARAAQPGRGAGSRFGVRIDQLALFLIAAQEARIAALEAAA